MTDFKAPKLQKGWLGITKYWNQISISGEEKEDAPKNFELVFL